MKTGTALVTGASSGIGYELCKLLARDQHSLVLVARGRDALERVATEMRERHKVDVTVIVEDLADAQAPQRLFDALADRPIDILVNNAGFTVYGQFAETELRAELEMIQVNITSLTHLTKLFLKPMLERKQGRIMNLASTAAFQPGPLMAVYYASKAYVLSFSEALANELGGSGVTVTALCPGPTATGFQKRGQMEQSRLVAGRRIMDATTVAEVGYRAMMMGQAVVVPGAWNTAMALSVRFAPRSVVTSLVRYLQDRVGH